VLDSIAQALRLDPDETHYLVGLAHPERKGRGGPSSQERVGSGVQGLIDSWPTTPAYVTGNNMTVLASNALAQTLSPYFSPGVNTLTALFCEPGMRELYVDWEETTAKVVAHLRAATAGQTAMTYSFTTSPSPWR
jgi:hypothetical protein